MVIEEIRKCFDRIIYKGPVNNAKSKLPLRCNTGRQFLDIYQNKYKIECVNGTFVITMYEVNDAVVLQNYSFWDCLSKLPSNVKFVLWVQNDKINIQNIIDSLSSNKSNVNFIINLGDYSFSQYSKIDLSSLPSNVKIDTSLNLIPYTGYSHFDSWLVNKSKEEFRKIYPFLTPEEQRRALKYRKIIATFLKENPGVTELNPYEKCEKVFDWVRKKTEFAPDDWHNPCYADPISTFESGVGVCAGRSRLIKLLLNNYYMQVPCYTIDGWACNMGHEWNEVWISDKEHFYYDINFGVRRSYQVPSGHTVDDVKSDLDISREKEIGLYSRKCQRQLHISRPLPKRQENVTNGEVPRRPLPPRNNSGLQEARRPLPPRDNVSNVQNTERRPLPPRNIDASKQRVRRLMKSIYDSHNNKK